MRVTILGCGTAGGIPRVGNDWGRCDPNEPRNRRRRASILVEQEGTRLLVDSSPDLREQALMAGFDRLDAVLYTHDHADHVHGIDDLRFFVIRSRKRIDIYADRPTLESLTRRFAYVFKDETGGAYPAILNPHLIDGPFRLGPIPVVPFPQDHGTTTTLGFRFGPIAYTTDAVNLCPEAFAALAGVEVWIVDALRDTPHPTHAHLDRTLEWIERVKPERAILTHMNYELDYRSLVDSLPTGVEPGYDGLVVEVI